MKIALIAPPYPLEEAPSPPLGLCYVAAACEKSGATVRIFDYIVRKFTPEGLREEMAAFEPDIIGTNAVTMNFKKAVAILKAAKAISPDVKTLIGGPHASFYIDEIFENHPEIDMIVRGESDETLQELIPVLHQKEKWESIRGIAFRNGTGFIKTPERPLIENLDNLPMPARHLLPMSRYQALGYPVSIITSRGCPNKCIFCLGRKMVGFKVRHRSTTLVVDEIEDILSYGFEFINIADDLFTANKKRVIEFCNEVRKRNLNFKWSVFARVNTVTPDILTEMKSAGCHSISFGVESGNTEMLKRVRKGITLNQAREAVRACKDAGISAHASFMAGLPGETLQTLQDSDAFSKELDIDYGFHFLAPFPGTTVRDKVEDYDLEILSDDWDLYDADNVIVRTSTLDPESIKAFVDNASKHIKENWEALQARYRQNDVTDAEHLQVAGYYRMNMIYHILSENLIEDFPEHQGSFETALDALADTVAEKTKMESGFTRFNLNDLIRKKYILYRETNNRVSFFWSHSSKTPVFK